MFLKGIDGIISSSWKISSWSLGRKVLLEIMVSIDIIKDCFKCKSCKKFIRWFGECKLRILVWIEIVVF